MRLEVRPDNQPAIALYEKRGYKLFARCFGYYEDNADALRLEKSLIGHAPSTARNVPYYAQTSDFTCGPAAIMMALAATGKAEPFSRRLEFRLWREATSIYLISAPGGCDPLGRDRGGGAARPQGGAACEPAGALFHRGHAQPVQARDHGRGAGRLPGGDRGGRHTRHRAALGIDDLIAALDRGAVAIVLISTYRMYRERVPHWIVVYDHDQRYIFAHDPFVDPDEHEVPLGKAGLAIPMDEFESIAAYGRSRLRAAIVVETDIRPMSWLILVDHERDVSNADTPHKVMTTRDYLSRPQLFGNSKPNIINLARSYGYQGAGYYCSLLAEARGHRVIPSVETIAELSRKTLYERALPELQETLNRCLAKAADALPPGPMKLLVCFGQVQPPALAPFARLLFDWFRVPILRVSGTGDGRRTIDRISAAGMHALASDERAFFLDAMAEHTRGTWRDAKARVQAKYTLAVLIDPEEELAPSTQASLKHFARIAARMSIEVDPISKGDLDRLAEYDGLFIRATTKIDNFTYRFARRAQQEGMPVIDDPQSMIRCTNKVYLAERLGAAGVADTTDRGGPGHEGRRGLGRQARLAGGPQDTRRRLFPRRLQVRRRRCPEGAAEEPAR